MMLRLSSCNLLGDTLLFTPAIRAWKQQHTDGYLELFCNPEYGSHNLLRFNPYIDRLIVDSEIQMTHSIETPVIEMRADVAFSLGATNGKSLAWGYGQMIGAEVSDLRYDYTITPQELEKAKVDIQTLGEGKPVVFCSRMSHSCSSNDPRVGVANKCLSNRYWCTFAEWLIKEGYQPVAIGSKKDATDSRYKEWPGKILYGEPIRHVAALMRLAKATVCVDNGIRHLCAAAGGNMGCISGAIPLELIRTAPVREEQRIYEEYRLLRFVDTNTLIQGFQRVI